MGNTKESLNSIQESLGKLAKDCPDFMKTFKGFMDSVETSGVLDVKTLELILVGLAVCKQCSYCIDIHVAKALKAGATKPEVLAAAQAAVLMGGGPALMYMVQHLLTVLEDLG